MRTLHKTVWVTLAALAVGQLAAFVHVAQERHSVCSEHHEATHDDGPEATQQLELAALRANPERFPTPTKHKAHEHCGVVGAFERACEKQNKIEPVQPALAPKRADQPQDAPRALPEVIYAYAPKTSPPRV